MSETILINSNDKFDRSESCVNVKSDGAEIKHELLVKPELHECAVCATHSLHYCDLFTTNTVSGTSLYNFLCRFTPVDFANDEAAKLACKSCFDLINVLEQAELEYLKLKQRFEAILSKNPLFELLTPQGLVVGELKREIPNLPDNNQHRCSEDKPLTTNSPHQIISTPNQTKTSQQGIDDVSQSPHYNGLDNDKDFTMDCDNWVKIEQPSLPGAEGTSDLDNGSQSSQYNGVDSDKDFKTEFDITIEENSILPSDVVLSKRPEPVAISSKPSENTVWKCDECNKTFQCKSSLWRHEKIHTGELNYQCDMCGKSFIHSTSFKMHKLSHSGLKPHACDVCGLRLATAARLRRHQRTHGGDNTHQCTVCEKRFCERYQLTVHSKTHTQEGGQRPPRRRMFRCTFCPERFMRRYMLERHCSTVHGYAFDQPLSVLPVPPVPTPAGRRMLRGTTRSTTGTTTTTTTSTAPHATPAADTGTNAGVTPEAGTVSTSPQKKSAARTSGRVTVTGAWAGHFAEFVARRDDAR